MSPLSIPKTITSVILYSLAVFCSSFGYADAIPDMGTQNLVAGFGTMAINQHLMNTAPKKNEVTIATDAAQATYLSPANSLFVGELTRELLRKTAKLGTDNANDSLSFVWNPNTKMDPSLLKEPLKSVDANGLLEPVIYDEVEKTHANHVIAALSGALLPFSTVNFAQIVSNLSGDKNANISAKLNEKQTQDYLAALRSYVATQTLALGNLYRLYAERQAMDPGKINANPALKGVSQIIGPLSPLKLENFMATRRIVDKDWNLNLITENPATLQREQVQLLAENLAETYQTRMTLERLLATMSVLVLELNQQIRTQLQSQIQNMTNPPEQQSAKTGL